MGQSDKKAAVIVPESVLKKRKRLEEWNLAKKEEIEAKRKKNAENRKLIFKRAEEYAKEYEHNDQELIRLNREAKLKGGFYVTQKLSCSLSSVFEGDA